MTEQDMIKDMYAHFLTFNREFGVIQAQVEFLTKTYWILVTVIIGSVVTTFWSLTRRK